MNLTESLALLERSPKEHDQAPTVPELFSMPFKIRRPGKPEANKLQIKLNSIVPSIELRDSSNTSSERLPPAWGHRQNSSFSASELRDSRALQLVLIKKKRPFFNKVVSIPTRFVTPQKSKTLGSDPAQARSEYVGVSKTETPGPGAYELDPQKRRNIEAIQVELMKNPFLGKSSHQGPVTGLPSTQGRAQDSTPTSGRRNMPLMSDVRGNIVDDHRFHNQDRLSLSQDAGLLVTLLGERLKRGQSQEGQETSDIDDQFDRIFQKDKARLQNSTTFFGIPLNERNRGAIKKKMYDMLQQLTGSHNDMRLLAQIRNKRRKSPGATSKSDLLAEESLYGYSNNKMIQNEGTAVFKSSSVDPLFKVKAPTPGPGSYEVPSLLGVKKPAHPDPAYRSRQVRFASPQPRERYHHVFYSKDRNRPPTPTKRSFHLNMRNSWNP